MVSGVHITIRLLELYVRILAKILLDKGSSLQLLQTPSSHKLTTLGSGVAVWGRMKLPMDTDLISVLVSPLTNGHGSGSAEG